MGHLDRERLRYPSYQIGVVETKRTKVGLQNEFSRRKFAMLSRASRLGRENSVQLNSGFSRLGQDFVGENILTPRGAEVDENQMPSHVLHRADESPLAR